MHRRDLAHSAFAKCISVDILRDGKSKFLPSPPARNGEPSGEPRAVREVTRNNDVSLVTDVKYPERGCSIALKDKEESSGILLAFRFVKLHGPRTVYLQSRKNLLLFFRLFFSLLSSKECFSVRRSVIDRAAPASPIPDRTKLSRRISFTCFRTSRFTLPNGYVVDGRWDNGRHKLKFRAIHAKTGELRTELSDLRPASGARTARTSILRLICRPRSYLSRERTLFCRSTLHPDARQYFSINPLPRPRIWRKLRSSLGKMLFTMFFFGIRA